MKDNFQFSIFNFQLFYRFLLWRDKHIKEKHFILIVSFLVGICTAAAAIVLKSIIHFIQHLLTGNFNQDGGELPVSALSGDRYPACRFVCKIYRTG